ncbi:MAG TPA: short-chain dehydrogenase [Comamonadaceae bacterium]|nr:short-chain dehydrogenase [Comamonadaceae bacterium]
MGSRVLVTGGSRGIGRAVVERLSDDGYQVVNFDLQPPEQPAPGEQYLCADVSDEAALRQALAQALQEGPITRLVNNAGIVRPQPIGRVSTEDLRAVMDVNLAAAVLCAQALMPGMAEAGEGRIVNISSRAALGKTERIAYASSKAALHGFTKALALEAGAEDVITDGDGAIEVLTAPGDFEAVKDALAAAGLVPELAEVTMRAENTVALEGDDAARMQKLLDVIEDLDDVQEVYHNAEL